MEYDITLYNKFSPDFGFHQIQWDPVMLTLSRTDILHTKTSTSEYTPFHNLIKGYYFSENTGELLWREISEYYLRFTDRECQEAGAKRTVGVVSQRDISDRERIPSPYHYLSINATAPVPVSFPKSILIGKDYTPWIVRYWTPKQFSNLWHPPKENDAARFENDLIITVYGKNFKAKNIWKNLLTDDVLELMGIKGKINSGVIEVAGGTEDPNLKELSKHMNQTIEYIFPELSIQQSDIAGPLLHAYVKEAMARNEGL